MATIRELGAQQTYLAYVALLELRPHLQSLEAYVQQVNQDQRAEGYRLGCVQMHLDSGVHRHDAHRLYLNQRMHISSYHFVRNLDKYRAGEEKK